MKIEEYKFGSFIIDGKQYLDDVKIINGKVRYWHDREEHLLKLENIKDLIDSKPEVIVIGTGASGSLKVPEDVKTELTRKRIVYLIEPTEQACKSFNSMVAKGRKVAAILHSTC